MVQQSGPILALIRGCLSDATMVTKCKAKGEKLCCTGCAADLYTAWPVAYPLTCDGGLWDGLTPSLSLDTAGDPRIAYDTTYHARCLYDDDEIDNNPPVFNFHLFQRAVRVNFFPQP